MIYKIILPILLVVLITTSCRKNSKEKITITGQIVTDCGGTPYANQELVFTNRGNPFFNTDVDEVEFTTDSEGKFSFKCYSNVHKSYEAYIRQRSSWRKLLKIYTTTNLDIGILNLNPVANYQLTVKVNNPYTIGDTLEIRDKFGLEVHRIGFPFSDTTFAVQYNHSHSLNVPSIDSKDKTLLIVSFVIYSGNRRTTSYKEKKGKSNAYEFEGCSSKINEIEMTVD